MPDAVDPSSRICKSDLCELEELHLPHNITPFHVRCVICEAHAGQLCALDHDPEAKVCRSYHYERILTARGRDDRPLSKSTRDPWLVPCGEALDESILRAMSDRKPRLLVQIAPIVENDYGCIAENTDSALKQLQRRFKRLCEAGVAMRVEISKRLYAYLLPDSRMAADLEAIRDCIMENFDREPKPWSTRVLAS